MGTEFMSDDLGGESNGMPLFPPGFESFAPLPAQSVHQDHTTSTCNISMQAEGCAPGSLDIKKCRKSRRNRQSVDYSQFDNSIDDESDHEQPNQVTPTIRRLPKGVIRGCADCRTCQKVIAKWNPDGARRPAIDEAPAFYPTEEEFKDTLKYIESIRPVAESYGICRIVPPSSWKPPCPLKEKSAWENSKFATRVQKIDKLQVRKPMKKVGRKRRKLPVSEDQKGINQVATPQNYDRFGFEPGPDLTMETFQSYANDFISQYFRTPSTTVAEPSVEEIEGEYWRIVERPTEEIEVLYGADLETGTFGSGFPKACSKTESEPVDDYTNSGWNLNNFPRLDGSLLSFEHGDISGVLVPWLYVGMCFSSFCWHVEDHHFYSLNYLHWGAPKLWYGVPGKDALKLEAVMKKHLPHLFEEQPDLLNNLVTQFSPSILKSEGVSAYRCVQNEGEFVITFPRAYHSGFNCGFNCAEAVNVAPVDWLPHGQNAVELYRDQGRKISVSHDKLLLGASTEAVRAQWEFSFLKKNTANNLMWRKFCGTDGILTKALKARIELELGQRENLNCAVFKKMEEEFDATDRECAVCRYDLHLSAAGCSCDPERFACLLHVKQLCSCDMSARIYLSRFDINELNMLADAVGGKLSFIHKWAKNFLGLSLNSCAKKEKSGDGGTRETSHINSACYTGKNPSLQSKASMVNRPSLEECRIQESKLCSSESPVVLLNSMPSEKIKLADSVPLESSMQLKNCGYLPSNGRLSSISSRDYNGTPPNFKGFPFEYNKDNLVACKEDDLKPSMSTKDEIMEIKDEDAAGSGESTSGQRCGDDRQPYCANDDQIISMVKANRSTLTETCSFSDGLTSGEISRTTQHIPDVQPLCGSGAASGAAIMSLPCSVDEQPKEPCSRIMDLVANCPTNGWRNSFAGQHCWSENMQDSISSVQKGPRIANVVRRIKCSAELLELGSIVSGNLWSTSQAIFPKGYKSRVKYLSITDPSQSCFYICQILDAGLGGPLFMVTAEQCPSETFINTSATSCWNMVRERLNLEIRRLIHTGRKNLPVLQPPGSIDGLEMFGLSSPSIIQAVESLDRERICVEYWKLRPQDGAGSNAAALVNREQKEKCVSVMRGLVEKASREELQVLRSLMADAAREDLRRELALLVSNQIERKQEPP